MDQIRPKRVEKCPNVKLSVDWFMKCGCALLAIRKFLPSGWLKIQTYQNSHHGLAMVPSSLDNFGKSRQ